MFCRLLKPIIFLGGGQYRKVIWFPGWSINDTSIVQLWANQSSISINVIHLLLDKSFKTFIALKHLSNLMWGIEDRLQSKVIQRNLVSFTTLMGTASINNYSSLYNSGSFCLWEIELVFLQLDFLLYRMHVLASVANTCHPYKNYSELQNQWFLQCCPF